MLFVWLWALKGLQLKHIIPCTPAYICPWFDAFPSNLSHNGLNRRSSPGIQAERLLTRKQPVVATDEGFGPGQRGLTGESDRFKQLSMICRSDFPRVEVWSGDFVGSCFVFWQQKRFADRTFNSCEAGGHCLFPQPETVSFTKIFCPCLGQTANEHPDIGNSWMFFSCHGNWRKITRFVLIWQYALLLLHVFCPERWQTARKTSRRPVEKHQELRKTKEKQCEGYRRICPFQAIRAFWWSRLASLRNRQNEDRFGGKDSIWRFFSSVLL